MALRPDLVRELDRTAAPAADEAAREHYLADLAGRPDRTANDERALVVRAQRGDPGARAALVEAFLPLIGSVARLYRSSGSVERLELLQEGVVGLLRALERFDPDRGVPFWGYAGWWVRQAMQQLISETTRPVVLSDRALRHLSQIKDAHAAAVQESGREPGAAELAARSGLSAEQVADLLAAERAPRSVDEPLPGDGDGVGTFGDLLADPLAEDAYERVIDAAATEGLHELLSRLTEREREILRSRYGLEGEERTLRDIARERGMSAERVRQIERRALGKLESAARGRG